MNPLQLRRESNVRKIKTDYLLPQGVPSANTYPTIRA